MSKTIKNSNTLSKNYTNTMPNDLSTVIAEMKNDLKWIGEDVKGIKSDISDIKNCMNGHSDRITRIEEKQTTMNIVQAGFTTIASFVAFFLRK